MAHCLYCDIPKKKKNPSVVFPLQLLDGNLPNSLFFFLFVNFQKIDFTFRWSPGLCLPLLHFVTRTESNGWASWMFLTELLWSQKMGCLAGSFFFLPHLARLQSDSNSFIPPWLIHWLCVCVCVCVMCFITGTPHTAWRFPCPSRWRRMTQTSATTPRWGSLRRQS